LLLYATRPAFRFASSEAGGKRYSLDVAQGRPRRSLPNRWRWPNPAPGSCAFHARIGNPRFNFLQVGSEELRTCRSSCMAMAGRKEEDW